MGLFGWGKRQDSSIPSAEVEKDLVAVERPLARMYLLKSPHPLDFRRAEERYLYVVSKHYPIREELDGPPTSGGAWIDVARDHREFFRLAPTGTHRVSLVARHVTPDGEHGTAWLPAEYTGKLLALAVDLHDRQERRSQQWHLHIPAFAAVAATISRPVKYRSLMRSGALRLMLGSHF